MSTLLCIIFIGKKITMLSISNEFEYQSCKVYQLLNWFHYCVPKYGLLFVHFIHFTMFPLLCSVCSKYLLKVRQLFFPHAFQVFSVFLLRFVIWASFFQQTNILNWWWDVSALHSNHQYLFSSRWLYDFFPSCQMIMQWYGNAYNVRESKLFWSVLKSLIQLRNC